MSQCSQSVNIYKTIPKTFPAKLKHDFATFLIVFSKGVLPGGKKTTADNISEFDIFFMVSN